MTKHHQRLSQVPCEYRSLVTWSVSTHEKLISWDLTTFCSKIIKLIWTIIRLKPDKDKSLKNFGKTHQKICVGVIFPFIVMYLLDVTINNIYKYLNVFYSLKTLFTDQ